MKEVLLRKARELLTAFIVGLGFGKTVNTVVINTLEPKEEPVKELLVWEEDDLTLPEAIALGMSRKFHYRYNSD